MTKRSPPTFLKLTVDNISPLTLGGDRSSLFYPLLPTRAQFMVDHSGLFPGLGYPDFPSEFQEQQPALSRDQKFISKAADEIAKTMAADLYVEATNKVGQTAGVGP